MNKFEKVSLKQFRTVAQEEFPYLVGSFIEEAYNGIPRPRRSTELSAGYDFFAPFEISLNPGGSVLIPTGIRVVLDEDKFLLCVPRSGLGFKFKIRLANTVGVIDADYCHAKNEGHIMAKLVNEGNQQCVIHAGQAFMQGIILPYFKTDDDIPGGERTGGFGSTDKDN